MKFNSDYLTKEIIKRVFVDLNSGLKLPEFEIKETISGIYEDGQKFNHPIYAGIINIDATSIFKCVLSDLSDLEETNKINEFALVCQLNDAPSYGLRLLFDELDNGLFLTFNNNEWQSVSIYWKARFLAGIEKIISSGLFWKVYDNHINLINSLKFLASM